MNDATWACPNNPFSHDWNGGLKCRGCDAERTAGEAITSLLAGWEGWNQKRAAALVAQHRSEVLGEATGADFFQPGHTYKHEAWTFRCDAITTHPDTGERTVLGWFRFRNDTWRSLSCGEAEWAEGIWADITGVEAAGKR
jgi:hypothetical protein